MSNTIAKLQEKIVFSSDCELHRLVDEAGAEVEQLKARVAELKDEIETLKHELRNSEPICRLPFGVGMWK